jgi:hypothetical protein
MPSEAATSYFHQSSTISYPNHVAIDFRIPCKGNIEGASAYCSISRAQIWHQFYFLLEVWHQMMIKLNCDMFRKLRNHLLMMQTRKLARID